jgi:hypothetical protein
MQRHPGSALRQQTNAERYATDPEYRASLIVTKYAGR